MIPVFDQAAYLPRALAGVRAQCGVRLEVVLVDDGSPAVGAAERLARDVLGDLPLTAVTHPVNRGLGAACNTGLAAATGRYVAYLPADDLWFAGHLGAAVDALEADPAAVGVHSGVRVGPTDFTNVDPDHGLQAVQVLHRAGAVRWRERDELESDDLERTVWAALRAAGPVLTTGRVSCEWTRHPGQRSRLFDPAADGGLNPFRRRYAAAGWLRFEPRDGAVVDEAELYGTPEPLLEPDRAAGPDAQDETDAAAALHVLLVGELAYNADRVLDLAERGVRLSGLWLDDPLGFMTVGPLPFGAVADVPREDWLAHLRADPPAVAYCLLNWRTVPLALQVAAALPDLPIVWHFKEAPQRCLARGDWPLLVQLWQRADHVLVCSEEERSWLLAALPGLRDPDRVEVMDGDLPRARWSAGPAAVPDPERRGVHTACVGRPIGLSRELVGTLAAADVHLHLHGLPPDARRSWLPGVLAIAEPHVHLHPPVLPAQWRRVLGGYDAGWLHAVAHDNGGEPARATWDDLNIPARLPTYAAAGLPVLLPQSGSSISAVNRVVDTAGIAFAGADDLVDRLHDGTSLPTARAAMRATATRFTFDEEVDRLTALLLTVAGRGVTR